MYQVQTTEILCNEHVHHAATKAHNKNRQFTSFTIATPEGCDVCGKTLTEEQAANTATTSQPTSGKRSGKRRS